MVQETFSPSVLYRADFGAESEVVAPCLASAPLRETDAGRLPKALFHVVGDAFGDMGSLDARTFRVIAFGIVLAVPFWAAIVWTVVWIVNDVLRN
jgi:hypothetical protein